MEQREKQSDYSEKNHYDSSFKLLFDLSVQGIFIEDERGTILDCNDAGNKMFGYETGELIGMNISNLVPNEFAALLPDIIPDEMTTGNKYVERVNKRKNGTLFATEICTKYTVIDGRKRLVAYIHDISEQKKIQQDLANSKSKLEKTLASRDKLFSIISHDLKSPMQSIIGFTELIEEESNTPSQNFLQYIHQLKESVDASYELLENLLNWALCQQQKIHPIIEPFNLKDTCKNFLIIFEKLALNKEITFKCFISDDIVLQSDKNMLQFILRNLLTNSIKFTKKGGNVSIKASRSDHNILFEVKDDGIGMTPSVINDIFDEEKYNSHHGTNNEKGTGLGLKVVNNLLNQLNSQLHIASEPQKGSTFSFTINNILNYSQTN